MSSDPDMPARAESPDADVAGALARLLELADSLRELPLDDAEPACDPPEWE